MSINRGMDKENVCTYTMEYYSGIKWNEIMPFTETQIDLETVRNEMNQKEENEYCALTHICGI